MNKIKEFFQGALGVFGIILYYLLSAFVFIFPILLIDVPFILDVIFIAIMYFFPISSIIFWIWSFIVAITGPQNIITIIYYIAFIIAFLPFIISTILDIIDNFRYK